MTTIHTPQTRTDPGYTEHYADGYELVDTVVERFMDEGDTLPSEIYLTDQNDDEVEITVDWYSMKEKEALELISEYWPEDDWDDVRPVVEALLAMPKSWLRQTHQV